MADSVESGVKKAAKHHITLSTITSILTICGFILPVFIFLFRSALLTYVSDAMSGTINDQVRQQVAPLSAGLRAFIESNIAGLEDDISKLEYMRSSTPQKFTAADAQTLTNKIRSLNSQRKALAALEDAKTK